MLFELFDGFLGVEAVLESVVVLDDAHGVDAEILVDPLVVDHLETREKERAVLRVRDGFAEGVFGYAEGFECSQFLEEDDLLGVSDPVAS